eukprot:7456591-Lingulodinium_polyedra.AAC.1
MDLGTLGVWRTLAKEDLKIMSKYILGVDITEVYSPERVNMIAKKFGLAPGTSFDLSTGWDFNKEAGRNSAWKRIREEEPELIIGSPPCTMFSTLQNLNRAMHAKDH